VAAPVQRPRASGGAAAVGVGVARDLPVGRGRGSGAIGLDGILLIPFRGSDACRGDEGSWGGRGRWGGLHAVGGAVPDAAGDGTLGVQQ
jgi:hypothetical protein